MQKRILNIHSVGEQYSEVLLQTLFYYGWSLINLDCDYNANDSRLSFQITTDIVLFKHSSA